MCDIAVVNGTICMSQGTFIHVINIYFPKTTFDELNISVVLFTQIKAITPELGPGQLILCFYEHITGEHLHFRARY